MPFYSEPKEYEKTLLSDLQGAWLNLRTAVVETGPFPGAERLLLHIDEGMSWECVRDLRQMNSVMLLICNLAAHDTVPEVVRGAGREVRQLLREVMSELPEGKSK